MARRVWDYWDDEPEPEVTLGLLLAIVFLVILSFI
tara:strand:- start:1307 stop:1411 length:105 start_codon:yes stop_codon:yes gene_type:complete